MCESGLIRKMDALGRVVIPEEYRHALEVEKGDAFWVTLEKDGSLRLRPDKQDRCLFCHGQVELVATLRGPVCKLCLQDIFMSIGGEDNTPRLILR